MENMNYENKILDAVQLLVDSAISKAKYDRTIQGVIVKCTDETKGQYVVSYQNSSFYAYSTDTSSIFNAGTAVYVLIPESDMSQTKTILGSVNKLGTDYINIIDVSNDFQIIGNSVVTSEDEIGVKSLLSGGDNVVLYDKDDIEHALVDVNTIAANTYFKETNYLVLGADFRTSLPSNQKYQGDYGLIAELVFKDNITDDEVTRTYVLNLNDMEGMPYNFSNPTSQKLIFEIDGQNFIEVKKLQFYCINFPHNQANPAEDIFISNIRLEGANRLEGAELEGNSLTFVTPAGIYFDDNDNSTAEREVNAVLRVDGKIVTADSADVSYYWFKENCLINTASANYNRYGGTGWECLNDYNTVATNVKEWISGKSQYITKKQDNIAQETTYKCVAIYNGFVLSRTFNIYNYSSDYDVQIASDIGTYFMCDNGRPTLTCSVNGSTTGDYTYAWGMINNNGKYSTIAETTGLNTTYHTTKNRYDQLVNGLEDGSILLTDDIQTELNTKRLALQEFATTMRVEGGVIYNLTLNLIVSFSYITCFVYNNGVYIGKSKILITNDLKVGTSPYSLVINNGDQVFKYNEQGISPASPALENPQKIFPLTFSLYDEQGKEIDQAAISATNVFWTLPTTDTMIEIVGAGSSHSEDNVNNTITYFGSKTLVFKIPTLYQIDKTRNNIQLLVKYKDKIAVAKTDLSFIKEGETGSNGTNYICRLVPNLAIGSQVPVYPIYRYNNTTQTGSLNYTPATVGRWFKAELFKDGVSIFSSATSGNSTEGKAVTLKWEILKNKYTSSVSDSSNFAINSNGEFSFASNNVSNPANIIKCTITYDGQTYYSTMPLMFVDADAAFKVDLVENTGFLSAMYTADGQRPSYNNAKPFKLKVIENISGTDTDISIATGARAITYTWSVKGSVYDGSTFITSTNLIEKTIVGETLATNEKRYQPVDSFDGLCVSNSLLCKIKQKNENNILVTKAKIYIPIHLYLNKYGNAAMNGWDGNSIEIDNDGGFILAPQVGAGKKEQDNSYTGIFMGDVREAGAANNEVGLFGYKSGVRTLELNAEDGSAKFGKTGAGQIVIAPGAGANKGTAKLYSSDYEVSYVAPENMVPAQTVYLGGYSYWKRVDTNYYLMKVVDDSCVDGYYYNGAFYRESAHTNVITPQTNRQYHDLSTRKCYIYKNGAYSELPYYYKIGDIIAASVYVWSGGTGLEIDLNDPHIRFGSGKFRVDSDGQVYATGFVSVVDLEQGNYDIPGTEKFKVEYATDTVQFETDAEHKPSSTITKNIVCKCYYKEEITSNYTAVLVDSNGNAITHNNNDGLGLTITKSGTDTTIAFTATSGTTIPSAINEYFIKFTYTPQADLNTTKAFYANLVIQGQDGQPGEQGPAGPPGKDGTSVTVKGSYDTLTELIQAHPSGNTLGDAYVIGQDLYVYTNAAGGSGASPGDWNDVGQFKGDDAKSCFVIASTDIFKSVNGGTTFTPASITITPLLQTVGFSNWAYSTNGGSGWTTLTGSEEGITINQNNTLIVENYFAGFNTNSSVVFKCTSNGYDDNKNPIADTVAITKLQDGMNGNGITSIVNHYLATSASSGVTINTPGWNTDPSTQILTETNKYLWNYETISYDRGNPLNTTPAIIGHYGKDGQPGSDGRGIESIIEYYAIGTSPTEPPSQSSFDTQVVAPTSNEPYLWNYEVVTYTDGNSESTDKRVIGTYGEKGEPGNDAYTVVLSNESHTFAATDSYAVGETITITPYVYKGTTSRTDYNISNITGGISGKLIITKSQTQPYTLSIEATNQLNTQNGIISFDITIDGKTFTKAFSWALAKAGTNGKSPTAYNLIVSHAAVIKNPDGSYNPSSIILTAKSQTGNSAIQNFTSGRYAIFLNGSSTATATPASSAGYSYTIPANTNSIRIALYNSSTGTTILDEQTVSIVTDGEDGSGVWTATAAPTTPNYTFTISSLTGMNTRTPMVGDIVVYSYYRYTITSVNTTAGTVLTGNRQSIRGATGAAAYTAYLTNESQTLVYGTAQTVTTQLYGFGGTTSKTVQIKSVNGVTAATTDTNTGITGIKFKVSSTSAVTGPTITFTTTTDLPQSASGAIPIVFKITDDSADRTINFTYSTTTRGQPGTDAKLVDITASSQVFKSTDGGLTFSPNTIVLTPRFQNVSYSKWYYIINGGTPQQITSGQHGLTISSGVLTISKSCDLYTDSITSITFKCESSNTSIYDTMTIVKLYDVTEIQIGGRNLLLRTSGEQSFTTSTADLYNLSSYAKTNVKAASLLTLSFDAKASVNLWIDFYWRDANSTYASTSYFYPAFQLTTSYQHFEFSNISGIDLTNIIGLRIRQSSSQHGGAAAVGTVYIKNIQLENGSVATNWTVAPEDSASSTLITYTTTATSALPDSSAVWSQTLTPSSSLYIWQRTEYQFEEASQNYNTIPVCIYTPTKITSKLQYCLRSSENYSEGSLISTWQDSPFAWQDNSDYYTGTISLNTTTHQYATSITIKRFQFIRTAYFDTNTNTWSYSNEDPYNQAPILDESWKMEGEISASKALIQQELTTTTNNNIFTLDANDGITVQSANEAYGIRLTSLGIQFKLNRQWVTVWNIDGTLDANNITVNNVNAESIISGKLTLYKNKNNGEFIYDGGNSSYTYINQAGTKVIDKQGNTVHIKAEGETIGGSEQKIGGISAKTSSNAEYFSIAPDTKTTTMDNANIHNDLDFNTDIKVVHITNGIAFISKG